MSGMETFQSDVEELVADWDVWRVVSTDTSKREIVIKRSDEDEATVTIVAGPSYPKGNLNLTHVFGYTSTQSNMQVGDALDAALEEWMEETGEGGMNVPAVSGIVGMDEYGTQESAYLNDATVEYISPKQLQEAKDLMAANCADPRLNGLVSSAFDSSLNVFNVRIGLSLSEMDPFRARALALDNHMCMVVELQFEWRYMTDKTGDRPKVVDVYQCHKPNIKKEGKNTDTKPVGALHWYLINRVGNACRKNHMIRERKLEGIVEVAGEYVEGLSNWSFSGEWEKFYENGNENILYGIHRVIKARVEQCTGVCLICDEKLPLDGMKTAICDRALCRHSLENYGLGTDVYTELESQPVVSELLIALTCASVSNGKARDTFTPMCPVLLDTASLGPSYTGALHFYVGEYPDGNAEDPRKNWDLLVNTTQKIPSISKMLHISKGNSTELRKFLFKQDPLVYPLLQWILSSNRTHVEEIPKKDHFKGLGEHQFHLISSSPEKEEKFREKRRQAAAKGKGKNGSGSFWSFHGSNPGNWHCILRQGLKNYSNTKYMSAGAAYGPGIYTARNISTSLHYMGSPLGPWKNAEHIKNSSGMTLIALCEIADVGNDHGYKDQGNNIVTIQDEDCICTRYLFAFPDGFKGDNNLHTDTMAFPSGLVH